MDKEGDLWDDSALINAFENSMSKYKMMHGNRSSEATVSGVVDETGDAALRDGGDNSNTAANAETEMDEVKNLLLVEENHDVTSHTHEPNIDSSISPSMLDALFENKDDSFSQALDDYNQLLTHYYELEEKRQQILQHLQQLDSWSHQCTVEGSCPAVQWGTSCSSQEYRTHANQATNMTTACPCCPYACQTLGAPCTSYLPCSLGGTCASAPTLHTSDTVAYGNSISAVDNDIVRTAMGAAERAISSLKAKTSENSNTNEENRDRQENGGELSQSVSPETDLTVVLNAWYSAGFYTGKYLMEQSHTKKQPQ